MIKNRGSCVALAEIEACLYCHVKIGRGTTLGASEEANYVRSERV